jgi:SAM-dependent methyltransferase
MSDTKQTNDTQSTLWNGPAGKAWVAEQALLDRLYKPFEELLAAALPAAGAVKRVLDVGCGTGATTLALARRLGPEGSCLGVDISDPMVNGARVRAEREGLRAGFLRADAQTHTFEAGGFDLIVSRFGVMFFDQPVQAFTNLRRAASEHASLRCIAWRSVAENPFMTAAELAAAPLVPNFPLRKLDGPGQFGFADPQYVRDILEASGFGEIAIQPLDVACSMSLPELELYLNRLGPVSLMLPELDEGTRARVVAAVRAAFEPFVQGAEARFNAACWQIDASAR